MKICLNYTNLSGKRAGIAQLVEYKLPKLGVASSNLVARSSTISPYPWVWAAVVMWLY